MSIVGPRPALPAEVATYDDYQRQRLLVKPGLTCYWQTRRNRDSITFDEWVDLDLWDARTVLRILSNETYAGTLVQGKTCKPDFRRKAVLPVDESEWDRSPGAHEAIVDPATFGLVRKLARRDMRLSPGAKRSLPLSGFLFCADCGATMARHASRRSSGKRFYYSCETHRKNRAECGMHKVWEIGRAHV